MAGPMALPPTGMPADPAYSRRSTSCREMMAMMFWLAYGEIDQTDYQRLRDLIMRAGRQSPIITGSPG